METGYWMIETINILLGYRIYFCVNNKNTRTSPSKIVHKHSSLMVSYSSWNWLVQRLESIQFAWHSRNQEKAKTQIAFIENRAKTELQRPIESISFVPMTQDVFMSNFFLCCCTVDNTNMQLIKRPEPWKSGKTDYCSGKMVPQHTFYYCKCSAWHNNTDWQYLC